MKRLALVLMLVLVFAACKREEKAESTAASAKPDGKPAAPATTTVAPGTEVGSAMPEYSSMWLDGSKFDMADKRGKVVLLNIWATWCGPCRYEIPELQRIHDRYAPRGFEVIGVSVDESGVESVRDFVADQKMTYPVALDAEGKLANVFQTSVLPTSVVVDRKGVIVWKQLGAITPEDQELITAIEKAL